MTKLQAKRDLSIPHLLERDEFDLLFFERLGEHCYAQFYENNSGIGDTPPDPNKISKMCSMWLDSRQSCESPIELRLFAYLIFTDDGFAEFSDDYAYPDDWRGCVLRPQVNILGYRVDFLLSVCVHHLRSSIIIECDGHDFHERTKQQALRDRARDRKMTAAGHKVLRFTGSEIFNAPQKCCEEISDLAFAERTRLEKSLGL